MRNSEREGEHSFESTVGGERVLKEGERQEDRSRKIYI